ncbi:hypothetical protein NW759_009693 [Fusarium solani]|nr:hypothetical protein NW759_009693 [Fusarium solani]
MLYPDQLPLRPASRNNGSPPRSFPGQLTSTPPLRFCRAGSSPSFSPLLQTISTRSPAVTEQYNKGNAAVAFRNLLRKSKGVKKTTPGSYYQPPSNDPLMSESSTGTTARHLSTYSQPPQLFGQLLPTVSFLRNNCRKGKRGMKPGVILGSPPPPPLPLP